MASLRSTTTAAVSPETTSAGHERTSLLVSEFLDAICYCSVSGRCFVRTAIIPLRWYEVVVNEKGLGAMLDAEHTVFDRQEWYWLAESGFLAVPGALAAQCESPQLSSPALPDAAEGDEGCGIKSTKRKTINVDRNNVGASTSCSATAAARPSLVDVGEFFVVPEAVPDPMTITDGSAVEDSRESSIGCGNANATARRRGVLEDDVKNKTAGCAAEREQNADAEDHEAEAEASSDENRAARSLKKRRKTAASTAGMDYVDGLFAASFQRAVEEEDAPQTFAVESLVREPLRVEDDGELLQNDHRDTVKPDVELQQDGRNQDDLAKRRVYRMLLSLGYVVRSGLKLGCDFLVYKGQQGRTHAEYAVLVTGAQRGGPTTWADVACKSRLCAAVGKKLVVVDTEGQNWLVKRWKF